MEQHKTLAAKTASVLLAVSLFGSALASSGGQVEYNQAGIALSGKDQVRAGESYTAPNGQQVPSVITYVDNAGGRTNYLSVRQISELLGVPVRWNSQKNRIDLGQTASDYETVVKTGDDGAVSENPAKPQTGAVRGPFTEIDPADAAGKSLAGTLQDNTKVQTTCGYSLDAFFYPDNGNYIVLTVTNNGAADQTVTAGRLLMPSGYERFTSVNLAAGQTLTRAFFIADGAAELESHLAFGVYANGANDLSDITVSLKQYK